MSELVLVSLLGGLLALEGTSVGQFMISRPVVAGTLAGWLLGDPTAGFALGLILETYLIVSLPVGASRYPEGGPATVIAVAVALSGTGDGLTAAGLAVGAAVGLIGGQVGGLTVTWLRRVNGMLVPGGEGEPVAPGRVVAAHLGGMGLDLVRGTVVTGAGVALGRLLLRTTGETWALAFSTTRQLLLLGGLVSLGILARSFGAPGSRWGVALAGLVAGAALGWVTT